MQPVTTSAVASPTIKETIIDSNFQKLSPLTPLIPMGKEGVGVGGGKMGDETRTTVVVRKSR